MRFRVDAFAAVCMLMVRGASPERGRSRTSTARVVLWDEELEEALWDPSF